MRLYEVVEPVSGAMRIGGTAAESRNARKELVELTGAKKSTITITEIDVKTDKQSVLAKLNELAKRGDPSEEGDE